MTNKIRVSPARSGLSLYTYPSPLMWYEAGPDYYEYVWRTLEFPYCSVECRYAMKFQEWTE